MDIDKQKLIDWLHTELSRSKGAEIADRLDWMDYCLFIFDENYRVLESHASYTEQQEVAVQMFADTDYASKLQGTFVRHLHNFLVSAKSLVEHTRASIREWYSGSPLLTKYEERIREVFVGKPLVSFIEDLRNYCVHKSPIGIITHHRFESGDSSNVSYIHKASILQWNKLSHGGREYLRRFESDIPIMEPIAAYRDTVIEFRQWFRRELVTYHSKEIYEAKWFVQAIRFAEKGDFEAVFRSCGLNPSLTSAFTRPK